MTCNMGKSRGMGNAGRALNGDQTRKQPILGAPLETNPRVFLWVAPLFGVGKEGTPQRKPPISGGLPLRLPPVVGSSPAPGGRAPRRWARRPPAGPSPRVGLRSPRRARAAQVLSASSRFQEAMLWASQPFWFRPRWEKMKICPVVMNSF